MSFYPITFSSGALLATVYGLLLGLFVVVFHITRRIPGRRLILVIVAIGFLFAPIAEELWIARQFGHLCDEAGLVVNKVVVVDGFYDDTHSWSERRMNESAYRFVEGHGMSEGKDAYWRHERIGNQIRSFRIDKPSARYAFSMPHNHSRVSYKIFLFEYLVADAQTGEVLAREKTYARNPFWFFVGSQKATRFCSVSGNDGQKMLGSLYKLVLKPGGTP